MQAPLAGWRTPAGRWRCAELSALKLAQADRARRLRRNRHKASCVRGSCGPGDKAGGVPVARACGRG